MASKATLRTLVFLLLVLHGSFAVAAELDITEILERGGQYSKFMGYLSSTDAGRQMNDYANGPNNLTLFAPTDGAIGALEDGFFERFSSREEIEFLFFHFVPQFFTRKMLPNAGNRVMTMAGGNYTLDFISAGGQQVSLHTGLVTVPVSHQVNVTFPLAVYSIDTVLQHSQLFDAPAPASPSEPSPASPSEPPASTSALPPVPERPTTNDTAPPSSPAPSPEIDDDGSASLQMKASWWFTLVVGVVSSWVVSL